MSFRLPRRKFLVSGLAAVVLLTIAAGVLPFRQMEIVPTWTVQIITETGRPVPGLEVRENWEFYGVGRTPDGYNVRTTDIEGRVVFPTQTFRASMFGLFFSRAISLLNVHASFGPSGSVSFQPQGFKSGQSRYATDGKVYDNSVASTTRVKEGFVTVFRQQQRDFFDFAYKNDWAVIKRLIAAAPATVNLRDRTGATPLILLSGFAHSGPNAEIIDLLLGAGAAINAQAKDGTTALHNAAKNYDVAYMDLLLSKGADPKLRVHDSVNSTENGFTPLHFLLSGFSLANASAAQKIQGIELLLAHGADINAADGTGASPLHLAAVWGDPEIVAALLARGANPNAKNHAAQIPLVSIRQLDDVPSVHQVRELLTRASAGKAGNPAK